MGWLIPAMLLALTSAALGQDVPNAPVSNSTLAILAVLGTEVLADGATTRVLYQRNYNEDDPLAKPFVRAGVAGQIGASLLGAGAIGGVWFALHRWHHERTAKGFLLLVAAGEGGNDARQFAILRKSTK